MMTRIASMNKNAARIPPAATRPADYGAETAARSGSMGAKIAIAGQNAITIATLRMRSTTAKPIAAAKKRSAVGVLLTSSINPEQRSRDLEFGGGFRDLGTGSPAGLAT